MLVFTVSVTATRENPVYVPAMDINLQPVGTLVLSKEDGWAIISKAAGMLSIRLKSNTMYRLSEDKGWDIHISDVRVDLDDAILSILNGENSISALVAIGCTFKMFPSPEYSFLILMDKQSLRLYTEDPVTKKFLFWSALPFNGDVNDYDLDRGLRIEFSSRYHQGMREPLRLTLRNRVTDSCHVFDI